MRRIVQTSFFAILISATHFALPVLADDIKVESEIKSATVYSDRASVTRTAKVQIPAGAHNLVFSGLPIKVFDNSFRIEGSSQANVTFGALSHKMETSEDFVVEGVKALQDRLEQSRNTIKIYQAEKEALTEANTFITTWAKQVNKSEDKEDAPSFDLDYEKWVAASDNLSAKMLENLKAKLAIDLKVKEENDKIRKINEDLQQFLSDQKQSYTVTVPFESDKSTSLNVSLTYQISDVGWQPTYDARLDVPTKKLELVQYGSVWQRTGEDWKDIQLTLSTSQPSRGASLPPINPIWLSLVVPRPKMMAMASGVSAPPATMEASPGYIAAVEDSMQTGGSVIPVPIEPPQEEALHRWRRMQEERVLRNKENVEDQDPFAFEDEPENENVLVRWRKIQQQTSQPVQPRSISTQITTGGFVGEYKVTGPATVKPDGTQAKLQIGELDNDANLYVQIKPQISADAFVVAKFTLKGDAPIIPGMVSLFRDGAFIGTDHIGNMIRPGEEGEMSFGIDDAVKVKRDILKDESGQVGLIAMSKVVEKNFVTEIQNYHKEDIQLELLEMIPTAKDDQITVEILSDKTTPGFEIDYKKVKGAFRWAIPLKAQQNTEVKLGWKVSWPKDRTITGLR